MIRDLFVDQTHVRGHLTGIERVALDLFAPDRLAPHRVHPLRARNLPAMIAAQQLGLPLRALRRREALLVLPGFPPGPLCALLGERALIYVHDTFLLDRPDDLSWKSRLYMSPSFALAMRWGRRFLVNSKTTGQALRRRCAPDALVALLRPGVRDVFGLSGLAGPAPYRPGETLRLLAIGTIEPRKDYPAAIALVAALNHLGLRAELNVVGRVGWGRHPFLADPPPFLTCHGYVDDTALRTLAGGSHLLLSTSKDEGLGLPLLEIQHGGLPVVAPDGPVFREVLGDSGFLIRPEAPDAAAAALAAWIARGGLAAAAGAACANVARWNDLAEADAARFRDFLERGPAAYTRTGAML